MTTDLIYPELNRGEWAKKKLQQYLSQTPTSVVADIGAGYSWMRDVVEELSHTYCAFDRIPKQSWVVRWDLDNPPPVGQVSVDSILFMEVLEHLDNPFRGLSHVCQLLRPGGLLFLTTPNPRWSGSRLSHLFEGYLYHFQPKHLEEHHVFPAWPHVTVSFLDRCGLDILEYAVIDNPELEYGRNILSNAKLRVKLLIRRVIELRDPQSRGMLYGIVARKRSMKEQ